jgi:hypothetical protein
LTATEVIEKHLQAAGGKERLSRIKSRIAIGSVKKEGEPESQMAIMSEAPNRMAAAFLFPSYELRFIYNGSNSDIQPKIPRKFAKFEAKYREIAASGLMFNTISLYNIVLRPSEDLKFEAKGTKKVKGRDAYVVEVKRAKGDSMRLYFDAESFMWVRTDFGKTEISSDIRPFTNEAITHGGDELSVDFYIETSDFRDVTGLKLPFKFEQVLSVPILRRSTSGTITGTISEYRHNELIDPKMFQ